MTKITNIPHSFIDYEGNEEVVDPHYWNWLEEHNGCDRYSISSEDSVWIKVDDLGVYHEVDPYDDFDPIEGFDYEWDYDHDFNVEEDDEK